ncbi:hypothetical protein NUW54_g9481 [Trametes sanguinea]|uniref:Uncharacterized protein n=1 Tax=Trametes sanguinea TaxID=158606 RepID=A0ACC1P754_9APHY|nr:hypothetical protein NUW54_g9481 [Trametes sanguinea]
MHRRHNASISESAIILHDLLLRPRVTGSTCHIYILPKAPFAENGPLSDYSQLQKSTSSRTTDIVFRPHITSPQAGDVWPVGSTQHRHLGTPLTIPEEARNQTGLILLGYLEGDDTDEHLGVNDPLAYNFPITAGSAQVTVPEVQSRNDYVVVRTVW